MPPKVQLEVPAESALLPGDAGRPSMVPLEESDSGCNRSLIPYSLLAIAVCSTCTLLWCKYRTPPDISEGRGSSTLDPSQVIFVTTQPKEPMDEMIVNRGPSPTPPKKADIMMVTITLELKDEFRTHKHVIDPTYVRRCRVHFEPHLAPEKHISTGGEYFLLSENDVMSGYKDVKSGKSCGFGLEERGGRQRLMGPYALTLFSISWNDLEDRDKDVLKEKGCYVAVRDRLQVSLPLESHDVSQDMFHFTNEDWKLTMTKGRANSDWTISLVYRFDTMCKSDRPEKSPEGLRYQCHPFKLTVRIHHAGEQT